MYIWGVGLLYEEIYMHKLIIYALSFPKTVWFNLKALQIRDALKLPIWVHYNTKLHNIHKNVIELENVKFGIIKFGFGGTYGMQPEGTGKNYIDMGDSAKIVFSGKASFALGSSIRVGGNLKIGRNFSSNRNLFIACNREIIFGDNDLLGWNITIRDSDNHTVIVDGIPKQTDKASITIGNHVWICACVDLQKGVNIPDDSIVAYRSCVTKPFYDKGILIGGYPAVKIKDGINWEK